MELSKIEKLLEKYLNAETSLQEEAILQTYFVSEDVAPHLQEYKVMFSYFAQSKEETLQQPIQLKTKKTNWKWLSVAASVALLFSVYMGSSYVQEQKARAQFAQVKNALQMLSSTLKKGDEAVANLYTYEDTVNKIFKTK